jgi:hypothetical protein
MGGRWGVRVRPPAVDWAGGSADLTIVRKSALTTIHLLGSNSIRGTTPRKSTDTSDLRDRISTNRMVPSKWMASGRLMTRNHPRNGRAGRSQYPFVAVFWAGSGRRCLGGLVTVR